MTHKVWGLDTTTKVGLIWPYAYGEWENEKQLENVDSWGKIKSQVHQETSGYLSGNIKKTKEEKRSKEQKLQNQNNENERGLKEKQD